MTQTDDEKRRLLAELTRRSRRDGRRSTPSTRRPPSASGLNRTDLRCLSILDRAGPLSPSVLAERAGLSRPATTTAIDRLVAAGYVRRSHDSIDRRRVFVQVTARARHAGAAIWRPLTAEGLATASGYDAEQLPLILDFVRASRELHEKHAARVRQAPSSRRAGRAANPPDAAR
jgi:DNA-binding MarR family transcriptional regulator